MEIRKLAISDYSEFMLLINDFRTTNFTRTQFEMVLSDLRDKEIWVLQIADRLVATASIIYETKFIFNICKSALIEDVCTKKEYRNNGYGKLLINHLVELARTNNCYKINLVCNEKIVPFYKSCNFEERGIHMSFLIKDLSS